MSRKRYRETINPQVAVQDYLDDLLQQMPTTSVLDELKKADDEKKIIATKALARKTAEQRVSTINKTQKSTLKGSVNSEWQGASTNTYSVVPDKSLASQRLEKKRALSRSSQKEFREPLILKTAPVLNSVFRTAPPLTKQVEEVSPPELTITTESRHNEGGVKSRSDKELTSESPVVKPESSPLIENKMQSRLEVQSGNDISPDHSGITSRLSTVEAEPTKHWLTSGKPEWAQGRFECLIFTVAGLKLAVPLVSLGAIHTMDKELTPLVGRPPWFLGLLSIGERNVRVVDSAQWIMPERHTERVKDNYKFVIRLNDSEWGMACDSVAQSFTLAPEEVRWRTDRGKRPWLAGTVIEHMCALMDVAAVSWLLDDAEKNQLSPI